MSAAPDRPILQDDQLDHFMRDNSEEQAERVRDLTVFVDELLAHRRDEEVVIGDLGGGDGLILDACLERFPKAKGILVDLSPKMLEHNKPHPRKTLVEGDIAEVERALPGTRFDLVMCNFLLHHCIGNSGPETRALQAEILTQLRRMLAPGGGVMVSEILHDSWLVDGFSPWLIYQITSIKLFSPLARRFGANTAGTGVLFASERQLNDVFARAGLRVSRERVHHVDRRKWSHVAVLAKRITQKQFFLQDANLEAAPAPGSPAPGSPDAASSTT